MKPKTILSLPCPTSVFRRSLLALLGCAATAAGALAEAPPNLLFIFTDDQRWNAIGYRNPFAFTPNLDRISSEGLRFNQATIVLPVCTPARAAVLTGRYGMANGATTYGHPIKAEEVTFACLLQEAGYFTAMIGKWHNWLERGNHDDPPTAFNGDPRVFGFDEVRDMGNSRDFWQPIVLENGLRTRAPGTSLDYEIDQTIDIIGRARQSEKPFAIYLSLLEPHGKMIRGGFNDHISDDVRRYYEEHPLDTLPVPPSIFDDLVNKPPYLLTYRGRQMMIGERPMSPQRFRANMNFLRLVTEMDFALGRLFEMLAREGLRENTYIIFMSDNGLFRGEHGFGSKGLHYEESIRVPAFVVGPGIRPGFDDRSLITNLDIKPTLLDLAGVDRPENLHGESLRRVLFDREPLPRPHVLYELPHPIPALGTKPAFSLRSHQWKFIRTYEDGPDAPATFEELYDLHTDPFEMTNLADRPEHRERLDAMRADLKALRERFRN